MHFLVHTGTDPSVLFFMLSFVCYQIIYIFAEYKYEKFAT